VTGTSVGLAFLDVDATLTPCAGVPLEITTTYGPGIQDHALRERDRQALLLGDDGARRLVLGSRDARHEERALADRDLGLVARELLLGRRHEPAVGVVGSRADREDAQDEQADQNTGHTGLPSLANFCIASMADFTPPTASREEMPAGTPAPGSVLE
jgi:hypothetical protein